MRVELSIIRAAEFFSASTFTMLFCGWQTSDLLYIFHILCLPTALLRPYLASFLSSFSPRWSRSLQSLFFRYRGGTSSRTCPWFFFNCGRLLLPCLRISLCFGATAPPSQLRTALSSSARPLVCVIAVNNVHFIRLPPPLHSRQKAPSCASDSTAFTSAFRGGRTSSTPDIGPGISRAELHQRACASQPSLCIPACQQCFLDWSNTLAPLRNTSSTPLSQRALAAASGSNTSSLSLSWAAVGADCGSRRRRHRLVAFAAVSANLQPDQRQQFFVSPLTSPPQKEIRVRNKHVVHEQQLACGRGHRKNTALLQSSSAMATGSAASAAFLLKKGRNNQYPLASTLPKSVLRRSNAGNAAAAAAAIQHRHLVALPICSGLSFDGAAGIRIASSVAKAAAVSSFSSCASIISISAASAAAPYSIASSSAALSNAFAVSLFTTAGASQRRTHNKPFSSSAVVPPQQLRVEQQHTLQSQCTTVPPQSNSPKKDRGRGSRTTYLQQQEQKQQQQQRAPLPTLWPFAISSCLRRVGTLAGTQKGASEMPQTREMLVSRGVSSIIKKPSEEWAHSHAAPATPALAFDISPSFSSFVAARRDYPTVLSAEMRTGKEAAAAASAAGRTGAGISAAGGKQQPSRATTQQIPRDLRHPRRFTHTKQIATIGPASWDYDEIERLYLSGVDVFRLNLSHGLLHEKHQQLQHVRSVEKKYGHPIAVLADLPGPKLRLGNFEGDDSVLLSSGSVFFIDSAAAALGNQQRVALPQHEAVLQALRPGDILLLDDGKLKLQVVKSVSCSKATYLQLLQREGGNTGSRERAEEAEKEMGEHASQLRLLHHQQQQGENADAQKEAEHLDKRRKDKPSQQQDKGWEQKKAMAGLQQHQESPHRRDSGRSSPSPTSSHSFSSSFSSSFIPDRVVGVQCVVLVGGPLSGKKGVNIPSAALPLSALSARDRELARLVASWGVDWIALSFVQKAEDIRELRKELHAQAAVLAQGSLAVSSCTNSSTSSSSSRFADVADAMKETTAVGEISGEGESVKGKQPLPLGLQQPFPVLADGGHREKEKKKKETAEEQQRRLRGCSWKTLLGEQLFTSFAASHVERGAGVAVMVKIEKPVALENIEEILAEADGLMVARGDLGVELAEHGAWLPVVQKRLVKLCQEAGKPVVIATQMLDSMTHAPAPTRAELTDVANAVYDGADAVMLSGETAAGAAPAAVAQTQFQGIQAVESDPQFWKMQSSIRRLLVDRDAAHAALQCAAEARSRSGRTSGCRSSSESGRMSNNSNDSKMTREKGGGGVRYSDGANKDDAQQKKEKSRGGAGRGEDTEGDISAHGGGAAPAECEDAAATQNKEGGDRDLSLSEEGRGVSGKEKDEESGRTLQERESVAVLETYIRGRRMRQQQLFPELMKDNLPWAEQCTTLPGLLRGEEEKERESPAVAARRAAARAAAFLYEPASRLDLLSRSARRSGVGRSRRGSCSGDSEERTRPELNSWITSAAKKEDLREIRTVNWVAAAAEQASRLSGATSIVVFEETGETARRLASLRPAVPIVAVTPSAYVARELQLHWGIYPRVAEPTTAERKTSTTGGETITGERRDNRGGKETMREGDKMQSEKAGCSGAEEELLEKHGGEREEGAGTSVMQNMSGNKFTINFDPSLEAQISKAVAILVEEGLATAGGDENTVVVGGFYTQKRNDVEKSTSNEKDTAFLPQITVCRVASFL